jgi:hypothetical protein
MFIKFNVVHLLLQQYIEEALWNVIGFHAWKRHIGARSWGCATTKKLVSKSFLYLITFDLLVRHYINDSYLNYVCSNDCGIYVLKFLEMWDGERKWGDKTMPDFTLVKL